MEWKNVLKTLAPTVAAALGGPLAGGVVALLGDALGVAEPTQQKIAQAIANGQLTGEQVAQIQQLELKLQAEEKERGFRYAELEFKDRDSARRRDSDFIKAGKHNYRADILAFLAVGGLVTCVWLVSADTNMPERAINAIMFVAGVLAAAVRDVYGFEFGSSRGSKDKDDIVQYLAKGK